MQSLQNVSWPHSRWPEALTPGRPHASHASAACPGAQPGGWDTGPVQASHSWVFGLSLSHGFRTSPTERAASVQTACPGKWESKQKRCLPLA